MDKVFNNDNMRRYLHMAASRSLAGSGSGDGSEEFDVVAFGHDVVDNLKLISFNDPNEEVNILYPDAFFKEIFDFDTQTTSYENISSAAEFAALGMGTAGTDLIMAYSYNPYTEGEATDWIVATNNTLDTVSATNPISIVIDGTTYYGCVRDGGR